MHQFGPSTTVEVRSVTRPVQHVIQRDAASSRYCTRKSLDGALHALRSYYEIQLLEVRPNIFLSSGVQGMQLKTRQRLLAGSPYSCAVDHVKWLPNTFVVDV